MNRLLIATLLISSFVISHSSFAASPLRIFIRSGPKTHGPGAHDHPSFLKDWVPLLNGRGAKTEGGDDFPTKDQLDQTDVLIIHRDGGGDLKPEEKLLLDAYTKRGGGIVVIHAGSVANKPEGSDYYKQLIGGSWRRPDTKWLEGPMHLYFTDRENPITKDCSNFEMDDEIYFDMDISPDARVLAAAYTPKPRDTGGKGNKEAQARAAEAVKKGGVNVYDIQPQIWTYERSNYRAFVCIPGHHYANFSRPNVRALLLRGIAWAGKRDNVDELCRPEELGDNLRYVEGGPTRPEKAAEKLEVHPEFNISLVASEPLINKVMNIDWDEKGRLWVCETPEYPNGRRELNVETWKDSGSWTKKYDRDPIDRISWLEDTNGDGVMDRKHVFADKLELVTSFCFYKNGVIACSAPDIWNLQDTDGDGICDKREKLYTGLGIHDTHAVINNLRWGLDGWIYATHGYSSGNVTSPDGSKDFGTDGSGVVRFKPDGSAFEQYASRNGNTWGLDITWDGQVFFTQPTSGTVFFHVVLPEHVLAKGKIPGTTSYKGMMEHQKSYPLMTWPEQAYVQIDLVGEFTAAAGCAIYEGGAWPEKWNYSYFTTEPTLNIVHHEFVETDGVTYKARKEPGREETEFIRSRDLWFRPIETRVGPDGALYVVDFYNQAVIHNDTRGPIHGPANAAVRPDRDHYFGRIWKLQHKDAKKLEVPVLDKNGPAELVKAITTSPNAHVKQRAFRMIAENFDEVSLLRLQPDFQKSGQAVLFSTLLRASMMSHGRLTIERPDIDKERSSFQNRPDPRFVEANVESIKRALPQLLYHYSAYTQDKTIRAAIIERFLAASDAWTQSAAVGAASKDPADFVVDCLASRLVDNLTPLVSALMPAVLQEDATANTTKLLTACAGARSSADDLKKIILDRIAQQNGPILSLEAPVANALKKLLANPATAGATLPLVAKWDRNGVLAQQVRDLAQTLLARLNDASAPAQERADAARSMLSVPGSRTATLESVATILGNTAVPAVGVVGVPPSTAPVRSETPVLLPFIAVLGNDGSSDALQILVSILPKLPSAERDAAFEAILKRPEASLALLASIQNGRLNPKDLGPGNIARLRTHPNKEVAKRAATMLDKLNPNAKARNELIAQFTPEVEKPGDTAKGKLIFTAACSICHKIGDIGKDVAPPLIGMGAHGPAELVIHVLDPNREVDPSFWAWNITKKNGETLAGIIASENTAGITLRNQAGDFEIRKDDIKTRENTRRSLMPEGLEGLGAENIRDILAFICGDAQKQFRILHLADAYTADSRETVFKGTKPNEGRVRLAKFGNVAIEGIPFFIQDAVKSATGSNMIVLKGGPNDARSQNFPTKVEVPINVATKRLQVLGAISGWGFPAVRDEVTALQATVVYASGEKETFTLKNGVEFADYIRHVDVPGSKYVEGITEGQQMRLLTLKLTKPGVAKTLVLESPEGNRTVPVIVAITADIEGKVDAKGDKSVVAPGGGPKEGGKGDGPLAPARPVAWESGKTKVLVIGGGSSHNFQKFFGESDSATLKAAGFSVHYTEDRDQAAAELKNADVAVISVNRKFFDTPAYRKALMDFADSGKGLVMLHPGTWYGFAQWPELNAKIVGGGARGHDAIDKFTVSVVKKDHPVMKGVPASFEIEDELYYMNAEPDKIPAGTAPIEVLAETSTSKKFGKSHPSIWVTKHDKAKIIGIAPGHDERVHDLDAFKTILANAVKFVSGR